MLARGTIVAGYRIDGVLGDGGMGTVYRATQLSLDREVALKLLSSDLGDDSGFRTRFQREGQLQAALDHDHIVPVYEAGQSEHGLFLAMRMIDGPTLKDLIQDGELDPRRSVRLLAQVAHALDAAHAAGLIHRDIKPQNILIGRGDHAFLADFGLIKAPDEAARLTGTGQFIGTIDYVAPEQIQGDPASAASDIYALAGVLYECLTGEVPFPRPNEAATLHSHVIAPPPRVTERRPELPPAIDEVVARGMAKDPEARPPSATELVMAASRALASAGGAGPAAPGAPGGPGGAQATVVRPRPAAVSADASTPALERASDGAAGGVAEPVSPAPASEPDLDWLNAPTIVPGAVEAAEPAAHASEPAPEPAREPPEPEAEPEPPAPAAVVASAPEAPEAPAPEAPADEPEEVEEPDEEDEYDEAALAEDEEDEHPWERAGIYDRPAAVLGPRPEPARAAPPAPARAPARGAARRAVSALTLLALLVAAGVAGYLLGHTHRRATGEAFTNSAAVNHLQVRYPRPWELSASPPVLPGMTFDAPLVLTRAGQGQLTAGTVAAASGPTLLSPAFRSRLSGGLPPPDSVRLGATEAYLYGGLRVRGLSGTLAVYAAPTSAGVATIVCRSTGGAARAFLTDCGRIASTLRLLGVRTYPLGPSPGYAALLSRTFGRLRASIRAPLAAMTGAKVPSTQAAAAKVVAAAYGAAAGALSGATVPPMARDEQTAIVAALRRCADAYGSVAAAAHAAALVPPINATIDNNARAAAAADYGRASGAVSAASAGLSQALRGLTSLGYTLAGQR